MMTKTTNHTRSGIPIHQDRKEEIAHRLRQVINPVSSGDSFRWPIGSQTDAAKPLISEATSEYPWDAGKTLELFWNGAESWQHGLALTNVIILTVAVTGRSDFEPETWSTKQAQTPRPIWEVAKEIVSEYPENAWDGVPTDLARNLDHYLYGHPKKE